MKTINLVTFLLVVIGAINWLFYGLVGTNLVTTVFGDITVLVKLTYLLTGLSGLHMMLTHYKHFVK